MSNGSEWNEILEGSILEFRLLLVVEILSSICTLLILCYIVCDGRTTVIKAVHNHALLLIIVLSFCYIALDLPFTINSYRLGYDVFRSVAFCRWWYWVDYTLVGLSLLVTAVASLQRYILVFKGDLLRQHRTRWLLHYLPLLLCLIYCPLFYLVIIFFYPCPAIDGDLYCVSPCYTSNHVLITLDWTLHSVLPLAIIAVSNIVLVGWMMSAMRHFTHEQRAIWQRHRKMTLQLSAFATLYVIGWTPTTVIAFLEIYSVTDVHNPPPALNYLYYFSFFICPLQPLLCLVVMPEPIRFLRINVRRLMTRTIKTPV
jgi:hypothetical protein